LQFKGSFWTFTQAFMHCRLPPPQEHAPPTQVAPPTHAMPQPPQSVALRVVSRCGA